MPRLRARAREVRTELQVRLAPEAYRTQLTAAKAGTDAEVAVYFADGPNCLYQLDQWLPVVERLAESHPVVLVLRDWGVMRQVQERTDAARRLRPERRRPRRLVRRLQPQGLPLREQQLPQLPVAEPLADAARPRQPRRERQALELLEPGEGLRPGARGRSRRVAAVPQRPDRLRPQQGARCRAPAGRPPVRARAAGLAASYRPVRPHLGGRRRGQQLVVAGPAGAADRGRPPRRARRPPRLQAASARRGLAETRHRRCAQAGHVADPQREHPGPGRRPRRPHPGERAGDVRPVRRLRGGRLQRHPGLPLPATRCADPAHRPARRPAAAPRGHPAGPGRPHRRQRDRHRHRHRSSPPQLADDAHHASRAGPGRGTSANSAPARARQAFTTTIAELIGERDALVTDSRPAAVGE